MSTLEGIKGNNENLEIKKLYDEVKIYSERILTKHFLNNNIRAQVGRIVQVANEAMTDPSSEKIKYLHENLGILKTIDKT